jgi:hypothetical protein
VSVQEFVSKKLLPSFYFDEPHAVDMLLIQMEQALVLRAWHAGWLPEDVKWEFWIEEDSGIPACQASMRAQRERA